MAKVSVEISVKHLAKDSLYRRIVEKAEAQNMTPIEVIYELALERGGEHIYIASPEHFHLSP